MNRLHCLIRCSAGVRDPCRRNILAASAIGAGVVVMLLDELVQKGWGLGSGISLFIMAGVAQNWQAGYPSSQFYRNLPVGLVAVDSFFKG